MAVSSSGLCTLIRQRVCTYNIMMRFSIYLQFRRGGYPFHLRTTVYEVVRKNFRRTRQIFSKLVLSTNTDGRMIIFSLLGTCMTYNKYLLEITKKHYFSFVCPVACRPSICFHLVLPMLLPLFTLSFLSFFFNKR